MDDTGTSGAADGLEAPWVRDGVHPDDVTAPQPPVTDAQAAAAVAAADGVAAEHPHAGPASDHVSAPGHHVAAVAVPAESRRRGLLAVAAVTAGVLVMGVVGAVALQRAAGSSVTGAGAASSPAVTSSPAVGLTPAASEPADATDTAVPPPLAPAQDTLVLGDSLGLVVYPWLADLLPDRYVSYQAEVGRSTPATEKQLDSVGAVPPVVIVSSGTNDPVANVLEESARRMLDSLGPRRCVVWVDIVRPDRIGDSQTAMNAALDRATSGRANVRVLRWSQLVEAHPEWMSGDGIHPNEAGSQGRAEAFAQAAQGCSALDPAAPRARREVLPQSAFWGPVSGQYRPPSGSRSSSSATGSATPTTSNSASPSTSGSASSTSRTPSVAPTTSGAGPAPPAPTTSVPPPDSPTTPPDPAVSTTPAAQESTSNAATPPTTSVPESTPAAT